MFIVQLPNQQQQENTIRDLILAKNPNFFEENKQGNYPLIEKERHCQETVASIIDKLRSAVIKGCQKEHDLPDRKFILEECPLRKVGNRLCAHSPNTLFNTSWRSDWHDWIESAYLLRALSAQEAQALHDQNDSIAGQITGLDRLAQWRPGDFNKIQRNEDYAVRERLLDIKHLLPEDAKATGIIDHIERDDTTLTSAEVRAVISLVEKRLESEIRQIQTALITAYERLKRGEIIPEPQPSVQVHKTSISYWKQLIRKFTEFIGA